MNKRNKIKRNVFFTTILIAGLYSILRNLFIGHTDAKTIITFGLFTIILASLSLLPYLIRKKRDKLTQIYMFFISVISSFITPLFWLYVNYSFNYLDLVIMVLGRLIINFSSFYFALLINKQIK